MAQIFTEATHLSAAFFTKQVPVNAICRDIPEAQCIKYNLLNYEVNDAYVPNAVRKLTQGGEGIAYETTEETLIFRALEHMLANLDGLNTAGVTQFCAEDTVANFSLDSKASDCFCTEYSFEETEEPVTKKTAKKGVTDNIANADTPSDNITDTSPNVTNDFSPSSVTSQDVVGQPIPRQFGTVAISGAVLWADTPYQVVSTKFYKDTTRALLAGSQSELEEATAQGVNTLGAVGLTTSNSVLTSSPRDTALTATTSTKTSLLVSLGEHSKAVHIKALYLNGVPVPKAHYRILDNTSFAKNGDINALRFMPAYKDLTVVALEDVTVSGSLDVRAVVSFAPTPSPTMPVIQSSSPLTSPAPKIEFDVKSLTYVDTGANIFKSRSLQAPFPAAPSSFNVPLPIGMNPLTPHWVSAPNGDVIFFNGSAGTIDQYAPSTGLTKILLHNVTQPPKVFAYGNYTLVTDTPLTDELLVQTSGHGVTKIAYPPGTTFNKAIVVDATVVDIFVNGYTEMWRVELAANVSVTKFRLRHHANVLNIMHTSKYYAVFGDDGADVYTTATMTFVKRLIVPSTLGTVLNTDRYSEEPYSLSLIIGMNVFTLNLTDFTVTTNALPIIALASPVTQMYDSGRLVCLCADNVIRMLTTDITDSASAKISPGDVLTNLGYNAPDHFDKLMTGFTATDHIAAIRSLTTVYAFPRSSQVNAVDITALVARMYDLHPHSVASDVTSVDLQHKTLTTALTTSDKTTSYVPENETTVTPRGISIAATYSDAEARLVAAQHYDYLDAAKTEIKVQTTSLLEQYGDTIRVPSGALYTIFDYEVGIEGVVTYRARRADLPERTVSPDVGHPPVLTATTPPLISWDFTGTKLHHISMALDTNKTSAIVFTGEIPDNICLNADCTIPVPAAPCTLFGQLVSPMPFHRKSTKTLDNLSEIHVRFNLNTSASLSNATYAELLVDPHRNLLIIGHEAIQFETATLLADNLTMKFSGLLRGRFNTHFFTNFHREGEMCFVYTPDTFSLVHTQRDTFTLSVNSADQGTITVKNDVFNFTDTTDVTAIGYTPLDHSVLRVVLATGGKNAKLILSSSPIIWNQVANTILNIVNISTDTPTDILVPRVKGDVIYWMATSDNMFPDYGVISAPTTTRGLYSSTMKGYSLMAPRNTCITTKQTTYATVVL